jgi:hypothetical protein
MQTKPARGKPQFVVFAGRAGQRLRLHLAAAQRRVVAAEVDCLAHFEMRIEQRAARLANDQRHQFVVRRFPCVGDPLDDRGARVDPGGVPRANRRVRGADGAACVVRTGLDNTANHAGQSRRVAYFGGSNCQRGLRHR